MPDLDLLRIKLRCALVSDRRQRDELRVRLREELFARRLKAARWGVSYSAFDGQELLEASLRSIRSEVDYINVVYQLRSWYGKPADEGLLPLLKELREKKLIDELIGFEPDLTLRPGTNERRKRNVGLEHARKDGCGYFMTMDCDEFYLAGEVAEAKKEIIEGGFTHTYCPITTYGLQPTRQILYPSYPVAFVPFFSRIRPWSRLRKSRLRACTVDQTRVLTLTAFSRQRVLSSVQMHHMAYVRKDLTAKYENSSFGAGQVERSRPDFDRLDSVEVPNRFNIDIS